MRITSSTRPNVTNRNVSSSVLSRSEGYQISKLTVKMERKSHGNYSAAVWKYFGELWYTSENDTDDPTQVLLLLHRPRPRLGCQLCV